MLSPSRYRPHFESLEDRTCPALSATQFGGLLVISGSATGGATISVTQDATTAGKFTVTDGTYNHTFSNVRNVTFVLGSADDKVDVNLGGNTFTGSVNAFLGNGNNTLSVENGTLRWLNVYGGTGTDSVTLGDGTTNLKVAHSAWVGLDGSTSDTLTLANHATVSGNLTASAVNTVNLNAGSRVDQTVQVFGGSGGNTVTAAGTIGRDLIFNSAFFRTTAANTLNVNGAVGRDVVFTSSLVNATGDTVNINANVGGEVSIAGTEHNDTVTVAPGVTIGTEFEVWLGRGDDTVTVGNGATIGRSAEIDLGAGNDSLTFGATVGNGSGLAFSVDGGSGNDQVTITSAAVFNGNGNVRMGPGDDTVTFASAFTFNTFTFTLHGGSNTTTTPGDTLHLNGTTGSKLHYDGFETVTA
jgi:hypothetical protein